MNTIKELRDKSGAGMVDCKKTLEEAGGDLEKAMEILRKKGIAKAAKRSDRQAGEGVIKVEVDPSGKEGYMLEVNAETDFVARNEQFMKFADDAFTILKSKKTAGRDALLSAEMDSATVKGIMDNLSGVIGEKLDIKGAVVLSSDGSIAGYSHMGGRIGVLVSLNKPVKEDLARDIAMQIAASNPKYISPDQVPAAEIEKEKDIYREQIKKEGKPENMVEKILEGKINKYFEDVCLVKQEYIKDDGKKVQDILGDAKIEKFIIFKLAGSPLTCGI